MLAEGNFGREEPLQIVESASIHASGKFHLGHPGNALDEK
jgi:hypothetical protein